MVSWLAAGEGATLARSLRAGAGDGGAGRASGEDRSVDRQAGRMLRSCRRRGAESFRFRRGRVGVEVEAGVRETDDSAGARETGVRGLLQAAGSASRAAAYDN